SAIIALRRRDEVGDPPPDPREVPGHEAAERAQPVVVPRAWAAVEVAEDVEVIAPGAVDHRLPDLRERRDDRVVGLGAGDPAEGVAERLLLRRGQPRAAAAAGGEGVDRPEDGVARLIEGAGRADRAAQARRPGLEDDAAVADAVAERDRKSVV